MIPARTAIGLKAAVTPAAPFPASAMLSAPPIAPTAAAIPRSLMPERGLPRRCCARTSPFGIVGWRGSRTAHAGFIIDALEQALHDRRPARNGALIRRSDRGNRYVSVRYTERLAEVGVARSVSSVGDNCDNASAETIDEL